MFLSFKFFSSICKCKCLFFRSSSWGHVPLASNNYGSCG